MNSVTASRAIFAAGLLCTGIVLGAVAARATVAVPAYTIENSVKSFSAEATEKTKVGYQHWFFDRHFAQGRTIKLSVVGPHQASHAPHEHEGHEFLFVLEGQAEFLLDGKTRKVGPQTALYAAPHVLHGIKNIGASELKYLVIRDYDWPAVASGPQAPAASAPNATR